VIRSLAISIAIAARSLLKQGKRTLFLGGAIAAVTALLVILDGLSAGIRFTIIRSATTLTTGHVNVGGFFKVTGGQSAPVITDYKPIRSLVEASLPGVDFIVERGRGWAKIVSDDGAIQSGVGGIDIDSEPRFLQVLSMLEGDPYRLREPNTILVFEDQVKRLGVRVGDAVTLSAQTTRGVANTIDCEIVAVAKDVGLLSRWNTFVPMATLRDLYQLRDDTTGVLQIHLRASNDAAVRTATERLRALLSDADRQLMRPDGRAFWMKFQTVNREGWTGQKLDVTSWQDELSFLLWSLDVLSWLTRILLVILLAIIVTGILNTMWIAIRERTKEIGTLRAVGMQRGGVVFLFVAEAALLGLGAATAGALFGTALASGVNALEIDVPFSVQLFLMSDVLLLKLYPATVIGRVALIAAVTILAALYPSLRAGRLKPIEAMSHFG